MTLFVHTWISKLQLVAAFEVDDASWVSHQRQRGVRGVPHGDLELHQNDSSQLNMPSALHTETK